MKHGLRRLAIEGISSAILSAASLSACSGPNGSSLASETTTSIDAAQWDQTFRAFNGTAASTAMVATLTTSRWTDLDANFKDAAASDVAFGAYQFMGVHKALLAAKPAAFYQHYSTVGAYWKEIGFDATKPVSNIDLQAALTTVQNLLQKTPAATADTDALYKTNARAVAVALLFGWSQLAAGQTNHSLGLDATQTGPTIVPQVANANMMWTTGRGIDRREGIPADSSAFMTAVNAARANNERLYTYASNAPTVLQDWTAANSSSPTINVYGNLTINQPCANGNCDYNNGTNNGSISGSVNPTQHNVYEAPTTGPSSPAATPSPTTQQPVRDEGGAQYTSP